jgi:uncharacterized protein (TIRG00374 family)
MPMAERHPAGTEKVADSPPAAPLRRRRLAWLHLLIPLALLAALIYWVDLRSVFAAIVALPPAPIALALGLALIDRVVMALKWRQLVRAGDGSLSSRNAIRIHYQAAAGGRAIPAALGADLIRVYLAARVNVPHGLIVASIAVEKVVAMLVSILFALAALAYLPGTIHASGGLSWLIIAGALVAVVALGLLLAAPAHDAGKRVVRRLLAGRVAPPALKKLLLKLSDALLLYRRRPGALLVNGVMAIGEFALQLIKLYVIARALGIDVAALPFFAITSVALFARRVAGNFDGWGLGEGAAVLIFTALGIPAERAVALFLTNFAVTTVAVLPGLAFFLSHPVRIRQESRTA